MGAARRTLGTWLVVALALGPVSVERASDELREPRVWLKPVHGRYALTCHTIPDLELVGGLGEPDTVDVGFEGSPTGAYLAVDAGDVGGTRLIAPSLSHDALALIKGYGPTFSSDERHLACRAGDEIQVYELPPPGRRPPRGELRLAARATVNETGVLMWIPGTDSLLVQADGWRLYSFTGDALQLRASWRDAVGAAVGASGDLVLAISRDSSYYSLEWFTAGEWHPSGSDYPAVALDQKPNSLGITEGLAVATFRHFRKPGFLESTELVGWSRSDGSERFRLHLPTDLALYPREVAPGYLLAEYRPYSPRQHHPDIVCLDLTGPWPQIAGQTEKTFLH